MRECFLRVINLNMAMETFHKLILKVKDFGNIQLHFGIFDRPTGRILEASLVVLLSGQGFVSTDSTD